MRTIKKVVKVALILLAVLFYWHAISTVLEFFVFQNSPDWLEYSGTAGVAAMNNLFILAGSFFLGLFFLIRFVRKKINF